MSNCSAFRYQEETSSQQSASEWSAGHEALAKPASFAIARSHQPRAELSSAVYAKARSKHGIAMAHLSEKINEEALLSLEQCSLSKPRILSEMLRKSPAQDALHCL